MVPPPNGVALEGLCHEGVASSVEDPYPGGAFSVEGDDEGAEGRFDRHRQCLAAFGDFDHLAIVPADAVHRSAVPVAIARTVHRPHLVMARWDRPESERRVG